MARRSRSPAPPPHPALPASAVPPQALPAVPWWFVAVALTVSIAAFATSLSGQFVYDDDEAIVRNPFVRALWPLWSALSSPLQSAVSGRPLVSLSLALNHALGGLDPLGYHVVNIALHLAVAALLFAVLRRTLHQAASAAPLRAEADAIAGACALVWLVHPLTSEVVAYTVLRTESMMALCYLFTLYGAVRGLPLARGATPWLVVSVVAALAGATCKESIVTAPLMVVLYDATFVTGSMVAAVRRRPWYYAGLLASWAMLLALNLGGPRSHSAGFDAGISPWIYLLNQGPVIATYLRLVVWPDPLIADYGRTAPIAFAAAWPSVLLVVALIAGVAAWSKSRPAVAFLGIWCVVTLAPTSSIVPIATEVGAERRMYLPLMALVVLAVLATRALIWRLAPVSRREVVATGMVALVVASCTAVTSARGRDFHDRLTFWQSVADHRPRGRAHYNLAIELAARGRGDEALVHYAAAVADAPEAHYALAFELARRGRVDEAIEHLRQFSALRPEDGLVPQAHDLLGHLLAQRGDMAGAAAAFQIALTMRPRDPEALGGQGDALRALGRGDEAARAYRAYLEVQPDNPVAYANLGAVLVELGRAGEALSAFTRAVELAPQSADARLNLSLGLMALGRADDALQELRRGLAIDPAHVPMITTMGSVLAARGARAEAAAAFRRALELSPGDPEARAGLAALGQPSAPRP